MRVSGTELVSDYAVLSRAARSVAITWLAAVACGTGPSTSVTTRARSLHSDADAISLADDGAESNAAPETDCPATAGELPHEAGEPLWLQSFGGAEITAIAADRASRLWITQADGHTSLLTSCGTVVWSRPFGTNVAVSPSGAYVAGTFSGTLDLGGTLLRAQGERDVYVAELDGNGAVLRAVALGGSEDDDVSSLAVDGAGRIVLSGPGIGTVALGTGLEPLWQKSFFGKTAVAASGDVLVTGGLESPQDFGNGTLQPAGGSDIFVARLSADGKLLFARIFGDQGAEQRGESVAADPDGGAVVVGTFDGSVDFGAGTLTLPPDACSSDAWCNTFGFAMTLDATGRALWSVSLGPMRALSGVAVTQGGQVYVSGVLPGGVRPYRQTFLLSLGRDGTESWRRAEWPDTGIGAGRALAIDARGNLIWSLSARPSLELEERTYVASLLP